MLPSVEGLYPGRSGGPSAGSYSMSALERSWGTSTSTGPGRPVDAMWKAAWMYPGIWRGSVTRNECLTTGIVIPVTSASWKPSVPMSSVRTWPVMKTVGTESIIASAIGVIRFVAPGPEVANATPTRPEAFA